MDFAICGTWLAAAWKTPTASRVLRGRPPSPEPACSA